MKNSTEEIEIQAPIIESKQSFIFGVTVGVAATSLIAMILFGSGIIDQANQDGSVSNIKTPEKVAGKQPQLGDKKEVKIEANDHVRGNKNAKVTIVEFSDIQCPYCSRYHDTLKQIMKAYPNDVRWVFKHFPLESIHPYARKAAEASECAGDQGKYWEYTDMLFDNQGSLSDEFFKQTAAALELKTDKFNDCLATGKFKEKVDTDLAYGKSLGVQGTPGSFINGLSVPGNLPYSSIEPIIKEALQ